MRPFFLLIIHLLVIAARLLKTGGNKHLGPKGPSQVLINAVVELKQRNPRFGCPGIAHTICVTFGIEINKEVVRCILVQRYKPKPGSTQGPSWLSLLGHSKDSLWCIDLSRCESLTLQSHWVFVVMDQWSRRIIGFGIHKGDIDGITVRRMFNQAISDSDPPKRLSTDNDPLFTSYRRQANLRILDVTEIKAIPYAPMSHPFIDRVIGAIRRACLDQAPFWNSPDFARKLLATALSSPISNTCSSATTNSPCTGCYL